MTAKPVTVGSGDVDRYEDRLFNARGFGRLHFRSSRREAREKLRVTVISPGYVHTGLVGGITETKSRGKLEAHAASSRSTAARG